VVGTAAGLLARVELGVGADHLRHREPRAEALAELAEGPVGDPCHRRDDEIVRERARADVHLDRGKADAERGRDCIPKAQR
jgi:hypothetical protein